MPIPSPGFTSADVATEFLFTPPWNSNHPNLLTSLADGAIPYTSAELAGRTLVAFVPNAALNWTDISSTTDDMTGVNNVETNLQVVSGINQTVTIRVDTTNWSCVATGLGGFSSAVLSAYVNHTFVNSMSILSSNSGAANGTFANSMTFTVVNNDSIKFVLEVEVNGTAYNTGETNATFNVKNQSSANTILDTFVGTCGASYMLF